MALVKTLCKYGVGASGGPAVTVFRTLVDSTVTNVTTGSNYAIMKLPKGFQPISCALNITSEVQATTIDVDIMNAAETSKLLMFNDKSVGTAGVFVAGVHEWTASNVIVNDDDWYVCIDAAATLTTAVFEVVVAGIWMLDPATMAQTLSEEE